MIDPIELATRRRKGILKDGKLLLSNFLETEQRADLEKTKGNVQGAVEEFFRVKSNIKNGPWETYKNSGINFDTRDGKLLMFDFNWWPVPEMGNEPENWNEVFIYQLKGCNIVCPFCFVDRFNNNGRVDHAADYFSTREIVDAFMDFRADKAAEGIKINVLRASGGEPSLVPEQWLWTLRELEKRGLSDEVYFQSDTNLLTSSAIQQWVKDGSFDPNVLREAAQYKNFGLLSCFKGTDPFNFEENTGCDPNMFEEQFKSFRMFADAGLMIYPHIVNPNPETLEGFMYRLAGEFGSEMMAMPHLFTLGMYDPVKARLQRQGVDVDKVAAKWADNKVRSEEILDNMCQRRLGVAYKEVSRPDYLESVLRC